MNLRPFTLSTWRSLASRLRRPVIELLEYRCVLANDVAPLADINTSPASSAGSLTARLFPMGSVVYYTGGTATMGRELWKSDGTPGGTGLVKDIFVGSSSSEPSYYTNVNGTLFFAANDGTSGIELWKSDGTAAGTVLVKDIWPGIFPASPRALTNVNGTLFFAANDGVTGFELWKSDGDCRWHGHGQRVHHRFQ